MGETVSQIDVTKNQLGQLFKAFVSDLSYYNREYRNLDSDAALGLRVAEGKINLAVSSLIYRGLYRTSIIFSLKKKKLRFFSAKIRDFFWTKKKTRIFSAKIR